MSFIYESGYNLKSTIPFQNGSLVNSPNDPLINFSFAIKSFGLLKSNVLWESMIRQTYFVNIDMGFLNLP